MFAFRSAGEMKVKLEALDRSQAVIEFATDGKILTANGNFLSVLGYSLDEIRGKHHSLFVDPADSASPAYRAFWARRHLPRGQRSLSRQSAAARYGK